MKALSFEKQGLENLELRDVDEPKLRSSNVLVRVKMAGVNPVDYFAATTLRVTPMPHIPGAEVSGIIEKVGENVTSVEAGDRVVVYNRVFGGNCDLCLSGREMICRNGGFAEYISVPEKNVFKISNEISWESSASIPVAALTPYHALESLYSKGREGRVMIRVS